MRVEYQLTRWDMLRGTAGYHNIRHIRLHVACAELRRTALRSFHDLPVQAVVPDAHGVHLNLTTQRM